VKSPLDARIEVARGEMVIGEVVVPFAPAGVGGEWQVGGVRGPTLRPLRFSERTRLSALAATSLEPRACLGAAVARAATVVEGELAPLIRETAALLLCGARDGGPSFGEAVLRVARAAGWDLAQITNAEATEIDRLAAALGVPPQETGWRRLVLGAADADAALTAVRDHLADNLLARVEEFSVAGLDTPGLVDGLPETRPHAVASVRSRQDDPDADRVPPVTATGGSEGTRPSGGAIAPEGRPSISQPTATVVAAHAWPGSRREPAIAAPVATDRRADAERAPRAAQPVARLVASQPADRLGLTAVAAGLAPLRVPPLSAARAPASDARIVTTPIASDRTHAADLDLDTVAPDVADAIASLLDEESDLRGLE